MYPRPPADTAMAEMACNGSTAMRAAIGAALLGAALSGCASHHGRVRELNPDCTQVSAEEQAKGNCMHRTELPDSLA